MDTVIIGGVPLLIYPASRLQGRWAADDSAWRFGALMFMVDQMIEGELPGWIEAIRSRVTKHADHKYIYCYDGSEDVSEGILRWSSFGGHPEGDDFCIVGVSGGGAGEEITIARSVLIELLTVLLERSGLDPTKTPPPLPPYDPNAPYASLPPPPPLPPKPPLPLRKNVRLVTKIGERLEEIERIKDPRGAYVERKQLFADMREMGFLREDLIESHDAPGTGATASSAIWRTLTAFEELRKYYRSAYRKTVFGPEPAPNVIGGPLSHQFFLNCRLWYPNAKERTLSDYRETRHKIIVPDDQHPHEILAILEAEMRRLADLSGDFGERRVEHDTFKALFRWEREDGVHASLTFARVDSW